MDANQIETPVPLEHIPIWPSYFKPENIHLFPPGDDEAEFKFNQDINKKVSIFHGDITKLKLDAIVNAANTTLLGGGGVDKAIHCTAGRELLTECRLLNGCETGDAKITKGYKLPVKYVIHTVGPKGENPIKLRSCYKRCFELVLEHNIKSVAFPCISTGIYGYPQDRAAHLALRTTREFLDKHYKDVDRIIFCLFLHSDIEIYDQIMQEYFPLH